MKHMKSKIALGMIVAALLTVVACNKKSETPVAAKKNGDAGGIKTDTSGDGKAVATIGSEYKVVLTAPNQIENGGTFGIQIQSINGQTISTEAVEQMSLQFGPNAQSQNSDVQSLQTSAGITSDFQQYNKTSGYSQSSNGKFALYYETRCMIGVNKTQSCAKLYITTWLFRRNADGSFQNMTDAQLGFLYLAGYEQEPVTSAADRGTSISMDDMVVKLDAQFNSVLNSSF
jgi:hypothetical protein